MGDVLLAGRDWKARALLRAQLIEEGVEVEAYETVTDALGAVKGRFRLPSLLVVDLSASGNGAPRSASSPPGVRASPCGSSPAGR